MQRTTCPKCSFQQEKAPECGRCGIVFERYRPDGGRSRDFVYAANHEAGRPTPGLFRRFFRFFRWMVLTGSALALILILLPSTPPRIPIVAEAVEHSETKVLEFQAAMKDGRPQPLELDESELNGWLISNLALQRSGVAEALESPVPDRPVSSNDGRTIATAKEVERSIAEIQSSVRDVKIELREDSLRAYVSFEMHGKALSLELEGRLAVRDGYLRLEPTGGKLGSLPLWSGVLEDAARRLFDSPENREKFRLPPQIESVRVEKGNILITPK